MDAIRADGVERRLGLSATPLSDHSGQVTGRVIHFQDLTDLRHMEQAVARAERLAGMRQKIANYKRFRELTDEWVDLVVERERQEREEGQ